METDQAPRALLAHPLRKVAQERKKTPEAWHAEVLRDESERLAVAVRQLEFDQGFRQGVATFALAVRAFEEPTGETA